MQRFYLVGAAPPLHCKCHICGIALNTEHDLVYADTQGEPFKAYVCRPCYWKESA